MELGPFNIGVNTLVPDFIPHDLEYAKELPEINDRIVAKRVFKRTQDPEDMLGAGLDCPDSRWTIASTIMEGMGVRAQPPQRESPGDPAAGALFDGLQDRG
jgi:hypothetical protein